MTVPPWSEEAEPADRTSGNRANCATGSPHAGCPPSTWTRSLWECRTISRWPSKKDPRACGWERRSWGEEERIITTERQKHRGHRLPKAGHAFRSIQQSLRARRNLRAGGQSRHDSHSRKRGWRQLRGESTTAREAEALAGPVGEALKLALTAPGRGQVPMPPASNSSRNF